MNSAPVRSIVILSALLFLPNHPIAGQEKTKAAETTVLRESIKKDARQVWEAPGQDAEQRALQTLAAKLPSWQIAADKQWPEGQFLLGKCCYYGVGLTQEPKEAVKWLRKAAEQNFTPAQCDLGSCYANGQGVTKDEDEAVRWWRKATEQGFAGAHALLLNQMCEKFYREGKYAETLPLALQLLELSERENGSDHPDTATWLDNLAVLYMRMGDYAKAEPLCQRSLKIREKALGSEHPDTASSLNTLANVYINMGDSAKAEPLYQRALRIREAKLGPDHPDTAASLFYLALLYQNMGNDAKAESLYQRALRIEEAKLGPGHPYTTTILDNLGLLELDLGRSDAAFSLAVKHKSAAEMNLGRILAFTSEHQRMEYQRNKSIYSILATLGSSPDLAEALLRAKGVILDSLLEDQLAAEASKKPEIKSAVDQLRAAGRRLTQLQMDVPKDFTAEAQKRRQTERESLEVQVENLQKALARNVAAIGQTRRSLRITVADVQAVLPKDTVLMELIRYRHYVGKGQYELRYGAVLIGGREAAFKNAKPGEPVWVALGQAEAIEKNLKAYAAAMRAGRGGKDTILRTLYAQLFKPVQERLPESIRTLVVCPDAELNFLNFATLITDDNKFLAEKFILEYVASGRDLVFGSRSKKPARQLVAFANPAFSETPQLAGMHETNSAQLAMLAADRRDYAGLSLDPLPGTEREVRFLKDSALKWKVEEKDFTGREASEAEVNALQSPYILHLATHGFFLPDAEQCDSRKPAMQTFGQERKSVVSRNPMQRSGLALAGAQITLEAWKRGETPPTENDGVLTAQEVGALNLKGTWLVVLSACDTGAGEARAGEGVLGLRRGFVQAGAQNLLMTLWPISDKYTVEIIKEFYDQALQNGNAPLAMAEVQRQWLVRLRQERGALMAARLAGPFVMTFQGTAEDGR